MSCEAGLIFDVVPRDGERVLERERERAWGSSYWGQVKIISLYVGICRERERELRSEGRPRGS